VVKMEETTRTSATKKFEKAAAGDGAGKYVLKLYISGMNPRSQQALRNLKKVCREYLGNNYELQVIDIYQQPEMARKDQIIAMPTLLKQLPEPVRRLIGDLSQTDRIILGLDLKPENPPAAKRTSKK
jgi:circadian clock protein KaiB